ncbi:MAG: hypothetical protein WAM28_03195 [Chlamydiales bacterium]
MSATPGVQANNIENNYVYSVEAPEQADFFKSKTVKYLAGLTIAAILVISILGILGTLSPMAAGVSGVGLAALFTLIYLYQDKCKSNAGFNPDLYFENRRRFNESWSNRLNPSLLVGYARGEDLSTQIEDIQRIAVQEVRNSAERCLSLRYDEKYLSELAFLPQIFNNILAEMDLESEEVIHRERERELTHWFENMTEWTRRLYNHVLNSNSIQNAPDFERICRERYIVERYRDIWRQRLNLERLAQYAQNEDIEAEVNDILRNAQNEMSMLVNRYCNLEAETQENTWCEIRYTAENGFRYLLEEMHLEGRNPRIHRLRQWFETMQFWARMVKSARRSNGQLAYQGIYRSFPLPQNFEEAQRVKDQEREDSSRPNAVTRILEEARIARLRASSAGYEDRVYVRENQYIPIFIPFYRR